MNATPLSLLLNASSIPTPITGAAQVDLHALVDNSGNLIGGNANPNFQMTGTVEVNGVNDSGTLLIGKILQFGFQYNSGTSTSEFDYRFQLTGGLLQSFYAGMDIGVTMESENSSTFTGSFQTDFHGGAKGEVGPIPPLPISIHGYKFNDLNGNGADNSDPRLNNWTITLTGTDDLGNAVSESTTTSTTTAGIGEYSFTGLTPGTYTVSEQQQTGWTKSVGGTTITLTSGQEAVSYSGEAGTLLPGQAEVVTPGLAFGNFEQTSIHGYKFDDLNDNAVDNSEPRLSDWTIILTGTDNKGNAVSMSTTTAAANAQYPLGGEYSFTGLTPGTYTVSEQQQTGWTKTVGGTTITLTSGEEAVSYSGEAGTLLPGQTEAVTSGLAFGNFKQSAIVVAMDKSPATPQSVEVINPTTGTLSTQFVPYGNTSQGGVRVATGDLNGG
ncbi:MAG: SdrD B-like domain-containing protein, partial [Thermoguttaceae bacterium]